MPPRGDPAHPVRPLSAVGTGSESVDVAVRIAVRPRLRVFHHRGMRVENFGAGGAIGEVTVVDAPHRLSWTFNGERYSFELAAHGSGCLSSSRTSSTTARLPLRPPTLHCRPARRPLTLNKHQRTGCVAGLSRYATIWELNE
jgi:hypothetical protein